MTASKNTTSPQDEGPPNRYDTPTPEEMARHVEELAMLHKLYPPKVIEQLYKNILRHAADKLKDAGFEFESSLIGNELFTLGWLRDLYVCSDTPTPEKAHEFMRFFGVGGVHEDVATVLQIMADNGRLEPW